eukprot:UN04349
MLFFFFSRNHAANYLVSTFRRPYDTYVIQTRYLLQNCVACR